VDAANFNYTIASLVEKLFLQSTLQKGVSKMLVNE
jgi:hypothetical protein